MHVLLIDGFNLVRRIYEARPHDDKIVEPEVISSATQSVERALRQHKPTHVCCIFDSHEPTWRHQLYPQYKANRKPTPPALLGAIPKFITAFEQHGVKSLTVPHYEADDVIATLTTGLSRKGAEVTILSTDKNFLQLLNEHVRVYDHFNEKEYNQDWVLKKYGVSYEQLVDYWALTGDSTNNVSGVPKIGPKTAQKLISTYGSLKTLLASPPDDANGQRIIDFAHDAEDAYELALLKKDVAVGINMQQLRYKAN